MSAIPSQPTRPHVRKEPEVYAPAPPSSQVKPRSVHTLPQQASTNPGDGEAYKDYEMYGEATGSKDDSPPKKVPFKEQVIGYAQKTRGTVLGKPDLKDHGQKILEGETTHAEDKML